MRNSEKDLFSSVDKSMGNDKVWKTALGLWRLEMTCTLSVLRAQMKHRSSLMITLAVSGDVVFFPPLKWKLEHLSHMAAVVQFKKVLRECSKEKFPNLCYIGGQIGQAWWINRLYVLNSTFFNFSTTFSFFFFSLAKYGPSHSSWSAPFCSK